MGKRNKHWDVRFVAIAADWFYGHVEEFNNLSVRARMVYFCLKSGYLKKTRTCPGNNGQITFSYSSLKKGTGFSSDTTISKALQELEKKNWIQRSEKGGLFAGSSKYELTGKWDPCL